MPNVKPVMTRTIRHLGTLAIACLLSSGGTSRTEPTAASVGPRCIEDLGKLCPAELHVLFRNGSLGQIPVGDLPGKMLHLEDRGGKFKVWASNLVWRGKYFSEDTYFANRWIGNRRWLGSHYVIGPSWADGQPAIILEYPPGTPLFANMHDEIREVAPGLYLGVVYMREPCPYFRGFFAIELPSCDTCAPRRHRAEQGCEYGCRKQPGGLIPLLMRQTAGH